MKPYIVSTMLALALTACETSYQDMSWMGGGVEATQIDERTLRVKGKGNAYTNATTTQDHVLLKAAEETLRLGFTLFLVVDEKNTEKVTSYTTPGSSTSTTTGSATAYGSGSTTTAYGSSTTTTTYRLGQTTYSAEPRTDMVVKMFTGEMPDNAPPNLYSAASIIRFLGGKYYEK